MYARSHAFHRVLPCPPRTSHSPSAYCFSATRLARAKIHVLALCKVCNRFVIRELLLMHMSAIRMVQ